jgi:hypothetical protein
MTSHWLEFRPALPILLLVLLLSLITVILLVLESKRNASKRALRVIITVAMMAGLAGILLRPHYPREERNAYILLTENFSRTVVDSLSARNRTLKIIRTPRAEPYRQARALSSYHELSLLDGSVAYVVGNGLPAYALALLKQPNYKYIPGSSPSGIISITRPDEIVVNRTLAIEGVVQSAHPNSSIFLQGPAGNLDSAKLTDTITNFTLRTAPKAAGEFAYKLLYKEDGQVVEEPTLPVRVTEERKLNILFIQQFPTFETQYLKTFLSQKHSLLLRYQLSRNVFRYEHLNRKPTAVTRLTENELEKFDLIFIDTDALRVLTKSETDHLHQAIGKGLGVILIFNDPPGKSKLTGNLITPSFTNYRYDTARLVLNKTTHHLPAWPVQVEHSSVVTALLKNKNRILAGFEQRGAGRVGWQLLQETFRLPLQGDSLAYSSLWSSLVEEIARRQQKKYSISIRADFPIYPGEPLPFTVITTSSNPVIQYAGTTIPLEEDTRMDSQWYGNVWPANPGWHHLVVPEDSVTRSFYVSDPSEWQVLRMANNQRDTEQSQRSGSPVTNSLNVNWVPLSPLLFYLLFLFSAGALWLLPKL